MKKTLTKSEVTKEMKALANQLNKLYDKLDNLMDEAEISAEGCTEKEVMQGKADWFNEKAGRLLSARDLTLDAVEDLRGAF